ncbi:DNA cytosine methyltransferase [Ectopseudomonas mendocina]|uniref:DNA cytosine methyltransferase n=1 Tax=Ectopseudomonas mendocina TaxID=300 RepID=A0ABZ2RNM0_ECTME
MPAYYNEIAPYAAQWLQNLIAAGHIAPGDVDQRSIEDVKPDDLRPYTQCHFFAGVGVWSLALRRAGWPDDLSVWTGSCPCQPFSSSGKGAGFADERHLWPHFFHLISECRPPVVFGEQVASKNANHWIDLVSADLEGLGFAFGAIAFPSAGVGAPHIRDRAYWVGHAHGEGLEGHTGNDGKKRRRGADRSASETGISSRMAYDTGERQLRWRTSEKSNGTNPPRGESKRLRDAVRLADLHGNRRNQAGQCSAATRNDGVIRNGFAASRKPTASPTNGFWSNADWLLCRDGKWRPVEPGTFPLAHGTPARVGRLRAYGNAVNAHQAQIFIETYLEAVGT